MSGSEISKMSEMYKEKMITEFTKFLDVYNNLSNTSYTLDIRGDYDVFVRFLGNYIYNHLDTLDTWSDSQINFTEEIVINMNVFKNTKYVDAVYNFLLSLKNAFFNSLDDDIYEYLKKTKDYTTDEKKICKEFYDRISNLNKSIKHSTFSSTKTDILSRDNISTYSKELEEFNSYSTYVSSKPQLYNLIKHFDSKIREISRNKKYPEILFNV
jgi:hypothetical protein